VTKAALRVPRPTPRSGRIATVVTLPDVCVAKLVLEAIVEDLAAKRELIERVENVVDPACILASNTSSISITTLGAGTKHPERIIGMHFFNPAPLMPLVEVVTGLATSSAVAEAVYATAEARRPSTRPPHRFIVNRCARPFLRRRVAPPGRTRRRSRDPRCRRSRSGGFHGPFELIDLIGLDVNPR
jgi:3-hydroxybutyryl-CoA dehydrogenase